MCLWFIFFAKKWTIFKYYTRFSYFGIVYNLVLILSLSVEFWLIFDKNSGYNRIIEVFNNISNLMLRLIFWTDFVYK